MATRRAWNNSGRCLAWLGAVCLLAAALYWMPGRRAIAPRVSDDNAYIFLAADRLLAGEGLSSLPPVAPKQPWEYTTDWSRLTKWPMGYPLLICGARLVFGVGTVDAAMIVNTAACALALVGWFMWLRRVLPPGLLRWLLAFVGAGSAFSIARFVNPSTDMLLIAAIPYLLSAVCRAVEPPVHPTEKDPGVVDPRQISSRRIATWGLIGLAAGSLIWLRYAAVFVAAALALHLIVEIVATRRCRIADLVSFCTGAALPVLALVFIVGSQSTSGGLQASVNLGTRIGFDFSPAMPAEAWWLWTDLPFYDYKWYSHWFFALVVPCLPLMLALVSRDYRQRLGTFVVRTPYLLSAIMVATLFAILVVCSTLFKTKFDFVGLERYYLPIRPLYFVLFAGPLLLLRPVVLRVPIGLALLVACSWFVRQEWPRPFRRWQASHTEFTRYGRWATTFKPHSVALYDWLDETTNDEMILFSNFHDDIALETGQPALPLPRSRRQLDDWVERVCQARRITSPTIRFVIDPDNDCRDYFLAPFDEVIATFDLQPDPQAPAAIRAFVFQPAGRTSQEYAASFPDAR